MLFFRNIIIFVLMDVFEQYKVVNPSEFQRLVGVNKGAFLILKDNFIKEVEDL
ncbi:hypothetical protein M2347_003901 [Chryseobacterium sp. H1D6B]|nr:hypothetical protein [Chryseobacterium sp. H1D6B]